MSRFNRIVIKVGSHVLTENGYVAKDRMGDSVGLIAKLMERGAEVISWSARGLSPAGHYGTPPR